MQKEIDFNISIRSSREFQNKTFIKVGDQWNIQNGCRQPFPSFAFNDSSQRTGDFWLLGYCQGYELTFIFNKYYMLHLICTRIEKLQIEDAHYTVNCTRTKVFKWQAIIIHVTMHCKLIVLFSVCSVSICKICTLAKFTRHRSMIIQQFFNKVKELWLIQYLNWIFILWPKDIETIPDVFITFAWNKYFGDFF